MITVKNISKQFSETPALDEVSFSVNTGEIAGFLGPNGAGKTTTMRIMTGFLEADAGEVLYEDKALHSDFVNIIKQVGYLPENNPLYGEMRVDEFLLFAAKLKGNVRIDSLQKIVKATGLTERLNENIANLSKGYRQRVGLAKALIGDVRYLILDEPTTGLDPIQKEEIISLIKKIAKNKTILFSSHILSEVSDIADKVVIINKGKIAASGTGKDLMSKHLKHAIVKVKTNAPLKEMKIQLQKNKNISELESNNNGKGFNLISVSCVDPELASREIFRTVVKNKWELTELYTEKQSMESLFKEITK
ncbi:MAG: ATP-binding cassette domain-containing protein [bacterium]